MADLDDEPAKLSELDLSEDAAIDGEDVQNTLGVEEPSEVAASPDAEETEGDGPSGDDQAGF